MAPLPASACPAGWRWPLFRSSSAPQSLAVPLAELCPPGPLSNLAA